MSLFRTKYGKRKLSPFNSFEINSHLKKQSFKNTLHGNKWKTISKPVLHNRTKYLMTKISIIIQTNMFAHKVFHYLE